MNYLYSIIFFLTLSCSTLLAQVSDTSSDLIRKGARLHDRGNYQGAISSYEKALAINPSSMSAVYEMSLSYLRLKDYDKALKFSSKVIEADFKPLLVDAYAVKGTALSDQGKTAEAVKLFKEALRKCGDEYLLHFNLGLCYFNKKNNDLAIEHLRKAIEIDATHSSAFLLYAYALNDTGSWVESFFAFHFFLLLEPNTDRSKDAFSEMYDILTREYAQTATELAKEDEVNRRSLYINLSAKRPKNNDPKAQYNYFVEASKIVFFTLSQMRDDSNQSLLWYFFVPTYGEILNSGYFDTYSRYVSVSHFKQSLEWWNNNKEEVDKFIDWFEHGQNSTDGEYIEEELEMDSEED